MPLKGAKFVHREWEHVNTCVPGNMRHNAMKHTKRALSCLQSDLRRRLARVAGTTFLDTRNTVRQTVISCDEGGWVRVDDLVRMEMLWTHRIRELTDAASIRDEDQRHRIYHERVQLLIDGNYLNAKQHKGAKIRLQFLGTLASTSNPPPTPGHHQGGVAATRGLATS